MTFPNPDIFLGKSEQESIRKSLGQVGTISEYFSRAAGYLEDGKAGWSDALLKATPWLTVVTPQAGVVAGAVGIAAKLFNKWAKQPSKPHEVGAIACTLAWQEAARVAIGRHVTSVFAYRATRGAASRVADRIRALPVPEEASLSTFSFEIAFIHPFVQRADEILRFLLREGGVPETGETKIFNTLHELFKLELHQLLANNETAPKFEPFAKLIERGAGEEMRAVQALHIHAEYQRAQFEDRPLFGREPFSLHDIYLDTECGELTWGQISPAYNKQARGRFAGSGDLGQSCADPFSELSGGRADLLQTALRLITEGATGEPIVVWGYAGQGKSSFTLRLCAALLGQGFIPIRVRLKKLRLEGSLLESLARAIEFCDDAQSHLYAHLNGFQLTRQVFNTPHGKYTHLSRYVLLLDGWDELEISASEGFRAKVHRVLEQVRREFLSGTFGCNVRLIVTGRPNPDVETSALFQERTPVLTLRNLRPEQLYEFAAKLKNLTTRPHVPAFIDIREDAWEAPDPAVFKEVFEQYERAFEQTLPQKVEAIEFVGHGSGKAKVDFLETYIRHLRMKYMRSSERTSPGKDVQGGGKMSGHMEVLGLPLLAYLTVRVMSEMAAQHEGLEAQQAALRNLAQQPTQLYRCLTDLTCEKAGKAPFGDTNKDEDRKMARELGMNLRRKLHYTAAAMTAIGQEHISKAEWESRAPVEMLRETIAPGLPSEDDPYVRLMISFYFKGGHYDQGIEFAHKSFREYLFAEHIVETLKELGSGLRSDMPWRAKYWLNFPSGDARRKLARTLGELFAPQWLSPEVSRHLEELLKWEITRVHTEASRQQSDFVTRFGVQTNTAASLTWEAIRDALADLWEWWTDGVHLRPFVEPREYSTKGEQMPPIANFWIREVCARDITADGDEGMESITNVDAHVGDAIFQLCCMAHYYVAVADGWNHDWQEEIESDHETKPFQTLIGGKGRQWRLFRPSKLTEERGNHCFTHWCARINAAFDRPAGLFPIESPMNGLDLSGVNLDGVNLSGANLSGANLSEAKLAGANLDGANLDEANLDEVNLHGASLGVASLVGASLNDANLDSARFYGANLYGASLNRASLEGASLDRSILISASFDDAMLVGASLNGVRLDRARLKRARLEKASLNGASLDGASLAGATLDGAILNNATFNNAILNGASLGESWPDRPTDLSKAHCLTVNQLRTIRHLTKRTLFPPGEEFEQLKQELLRRQDEWGSASDYEEDTASDE